MADDAARQDVYAGQRLMANTDARKTPGRRPHLGAAVVAAACTIASMRGEAARGQVMEIGSDGAVTTYAGPTVYTSQGAAPIRSAEASGPVRRSAAASREDFKQAANRAGLSLDLIAAVAWRESRLRGDAVSPKGAIGEMQLMPATARALKVDPTDAAQNVRGGAAYLGALMRRYDGDLLRALAAYNAGTAAVDRYRGVPPFKETRAYVDAVLDRLSQVVVPVSATVAVRR